MQHYHRIRDLREDCDLTQSELCKRLFMHKTTYTNYEQGKHTVPLDFAVTLADFYDVSLDYIAGRTNFKHGKSNPDFNRELVEIADKFSLLSERNKGRLEQFIDQLLDSQNDSKALS